jgi:hypothetical protein
MVWPSGWSLGTLGGSGATGKEGPSLGCLREPRGFSIWHLSLSLVRETDHASPQVDHAGQGDGPGGTNADRSTGCRGLRPPPLTLPDGRLQTRPPPWCPPFGDPCPAVMLHFSTAAARPGSPRTGRGALSNLRAHLSVRTATGQSPRRQPPGAATSGLVPRCPTAGHLHLDWQASTGEDSLWHWASQHAREPPSRLRSRQSQQACSPLPATGPATTGAPGSRQPRRSHARHARLRRARTATARPATGSWG